MTEKRVRKIAAGNYEHLLTGIATLLETARLTAARALNGILTATYWEIGRRIVEHEQSGRKRAEYGAGLLARLSTDLSSMHRRGFSERNLEQMRAFYLGWEISQTPSAEFEARTKFLPADSSRSTLSMADAAPPGAFPLSWSHYVRLLGVDKPQARAFYETEAIRGGWSVRQLDRQIGTQFYERAVRAKLPKAVIEKGATPLAGDQVTVEEEVRDPYLLEFLNLKDEYSESDLEDALIRHLEWFLLELGTGFTFVARQKRIRIGGSWYRIDLLLYHRGLRCLVVIDLKTGAFTHADAGQMNLYLNYSREHMMLPGETDPIGIILCSGKDDAVVRYATGGIRAKVFAAKYLTSLPDAETLRKEILTTQRALAARLIEKGDS